MRKPYTYIIGWRSLDKWYYGRRTGKNCNPDEFWVKYFTSSHVVKQYRELYGEPDVIKIMKTFDNVDSCKLHEEKFLKRVDARNNSRFLNLVNSDHKLNPINTGPCTDSRRVSISKGRLLTEKKQCIHCKKYADPGNFSYNHGDRCKFNPNLDESIKIEKRLRAKESIKKQIINGTFKKPETPEGIFECPKCGKTGTNFGNMHLHHFDNCGIRRTRTFVKKCCCIKCRRELDMGNFFLHKC